ncbi:MAG TPA: alpha/beta hydrolase [Candidatus Eisenbacteria bacterium]|nr:alpha/beta hydrolase [Candidatus Eisenbacteria bacterium]
MFDAAVALEGDPGPPGTSAGAADRPAVVLVHGATADHTTFRALAPVLGRTRRLHAIDRRGRGASGDNPAYSIEREFQDVAAVAEAVAEQAGGPVDVLGHSYGGRCALGASILTDAIRRVVAYEGAPLPPGISYRPAGLLEAVRAALARGDRDLALSTFLRGIVGMSEEDLARYRADQVWPARVAAADTIVREVDAETSEPASLEALAAVAVPVLLVLGSVSRSPFALGTEALAARLPNAEVAVIEGAAHAAHHTHVPQFTAAVSGFLDR